MAAASTPAAHFDQGGLQRPMPRPAANQMNPGAYIAELRGLVDATTARAEAAEEENDQLRRELAQARERFLRLADHNDAMEGEIIRLRAGARAVRDQAVHCVGNDMRRVRASIAALRTVVVEQANAFWEEMGAARDAVADWSSDEARRYRRGMAKLNPAPSNGASSQPSSRYGAQSSSRGGQRAGSAESADDAEIARNIPLLAHLSAGAPQRSKSVSPPAPTIDPPHTGAAAAGGACPHCVETAARLDDELRAAEARAAAEGERWAEHLRNMKAAHRETVQSLELDVRVLRATLARHGVDAAGPRAHPAGHVSAADADAGSEHARLAAEGRWAEQALGVRQRSLGRPASPQRAASPHREAPMSRSALYEHSRPHSSSAAPLQREASATSRPSSRHQPRNTSALSSYSARHATSATTKSSSPSRWR